MWRKASSIRDTLFFAIGSLTLLIVILVSHKTYESWEKLENTKQIRQLTLLNTQIFRAIVNLSEERGIVYLLLLSPDDTHIGIWKPNLTRSREEANSFLNISLEPAKSLYLLDRNGLHTQIEQQVVVINDLRRRVDAAITNPSGNDHALANEWFEQTTHLMELLQDLTLVLYEDYADLSRTLTRSQRFNYLISVITEYAGRERSFNGKLIMAGLAPTVEEQASQWRWQGTVDQSWKIASSLIEDNEVKAYFDEARSHYYSSFEIMHNIYEKSNGGEVVYLISQELWLQLASEALESLAKLSEASLNHTLLFAERTENDARKEILLQILLLLFTFSLCLYSIHVINSRVMKPIHNMADALYAVMQGKPVSLDTSGTQRSDEIGKLASVLADYQASSEKVKRTSAELVRHVKALERSNKELDDFAYIASHDLKEPLRGLHNHARFLLEDNEGKLDPDSINRLHRLMQLTQRMEKLINDLLYFSRLGRQEMAIQPADMNEIIEDIKETLEHMLEERNGTIVIPEPLPTLVCDQIRITEVFRNLITNALKYNESEEKIIEVGFTQKRKTPDGEMVKDVLYVKDNGIGIAPEFRTEVFRIFRRLQARKGKEEGTGVGLTFVKKIIDRHGGTIWLESEPDNGTTFYFTVQGNSS